ncbi:UPF0166 protein [Tepiditoga spiralis]|uniref:UPF0166 protein n=1 Tax=Tepiditoga spiralis TaxID=2108365 RepID=A0A7G1G4Q8_9BACT|nr:DUF190 domain-containing protein [Tepiditoga spiralis]BBE31520.1 UPF0166 protein [Tepiditoga spiralis]
MKLLKIYLGEKDNHGHKRMYEKIMELAYNEGLKGITVYKGIAGFGEKHHIHKSDFFTLSEDLPIIIEIIDKKEKIINFQKIIANLKFDGIMFTQPIENYEEYKK